MRSGLEPAEPKVMLVKLDWLRDSRPRVEWVEDGDVGFDADACCCCCCCCCRCCDAVGAVGAVVPPASSNLTSAGSSDDDDAISIYH